MLLAALVPGSRCPRCGEPMWPRYQALDLDHAVPRSQGGAAGPKRLAHASCNRRHGAELTNEARAALAAHVCTYDGCHADRDRCACGRHSKGW